MIDEELRYLAGLLAGHVPADVVDELLVYVRAGVARPSFRDIDELVADE